MLSQLSRRVLINNAALRSSRNIHLTAVNTTFWEREKKSGYARKYPIVSKKLVLDGLKMLKGEIKMWKDEMQEKLEGDMICAYRPGETDIAWRFNDDEDLNRFIVTSDSDHAQGRSTATFERSSAGYGLFSGNLSDQLPNDGKIKRAGYCTIRSIRAKKSFQRDTYYDWTAYNTLVLKVRGDGRPYLLNISCEGYFDLTWNDMYHYVLYTRGGPHWQVTRVPFSKFVLSSKGMVQDLQTPVPLYRVSHFGISASGRGGFTGNFGLEIDYIGLEYDHDHTEQFAYEMYKQDKYIVAT